ncbi:MAG: alpha/beta hydrolase [Chloroflexi bacterium]|nr:alpha/beta hydrolase [Chloroflexota bacterium]
MTTVPTYGLSLFQAARAMGVPFKVERVPEDKFVEVGGLKLHYLDWGTKGKPWMLFLHGGSQQAHSWDFVALHFCPDYHVIALDQRGHGDTEWAPEGDYSGAAHQKDITGFVDAIGMDKFILTGLSMGGRNAYTYAANHAAKVRALVIVDVGPEVNAPGTGRIRQFVQDSQEAEFDEWVKRTLQFDPFRTEEQVRGSLLHNLRKLPNGKWGPKYDTRFRGSGRGEAGSDTAEGWKLVSRIKTPTLIIRGGNSDVFFEAHAVKLQQAIPGSKWVTVPKAGHHVQGDNPVGLISEVGGFLKGLKM